MEAGYAESFPAHATIIHIDFMFLQFITHKSSDHWIAAEIVVIKSKLKPTQCWCIIVAVSVDFSRMHVLVVCLFVCETCFKMQSGISKR
jgi:hypothetical protein